MDAYYYRLRLEASFNFWIKDLKKTRDPECALTIGVGAQSMGGNGLIVSFGAVMPMRLGRLQRQSRRAFCASAAAGSVHLRACWLVLSETDANRKARALTLATESMIRAARSIGAVRTRRIGGEWLERLPDAVRRWR